MATALTLSGPTGYCAGSKQTSGPFVGYSSSKNYVLCYSFTTPTNGYISSLTFSTTFRHHFGTGTVTRTVRVKVTTSSTSHQNAGANTTDYDGTFSFSSQANQTISCTINGLWLAPGTTYYLYLFPGNTNGFLNYCYNNSGADMSSLTYSLATQTYTLSISAWAGSSITVNRTNSSVGATGVLGNGATLYSGDMLTITFAASTGYNIASQTVNGVAFTSGSSYTVSGDTSVVSVAALKTYVLSIGSLGNGSVSVNRTSSLSGSTGIIYSGATLYYYDTLKITFAVNSGYYFTSTLVNGASFASGSTHNVTGNVTITATSAASASVIIATNAEIGSASVITISSGSPSYTHTLTYSFENLSGTIVSATTLNVISWQIPTSFYSQIPNASYGYCTITCEAFSGGTSLGTSSYSIKITTSADACKPYVSGTVVDINSTTVALTGNSSTLVRYKSSAYCTINASAQNGASITGLAINGIPVSSSSVALTIDAVESRSFNFVATDSRGYSSSYVSTYSMIPYVKLTINPTFYRPDPTSGEIALTFSGNYYNGSFGAHSNTLTIAYRYRLSEDSVFGSWITVNPAYYVTGTSMYNTTDAISLGTFFDYDKSYVFDIMAYDGVAGCTLTTVTSEQTVRSGIPVFDWGEHDFNFNVDVKINDINIYDIFYPVNSVFMSVSSTMPSHLSSHGTWNSIASSISNVYCWKRTA